MFAYNVALNYWMVLAHCLQSILKTTYRQLRARRALLQIKDVPLRTRRALSPYTLYSNSALLVLNYRYITHTPSIHLNSPYKTYMFWLLWDLVGHNVMTPGYVWWLESRQCYTEPIYSTVISQDRHSWNLQFKDISQLCSCATWPRRPAVLNKSITIHESCSGTTFMCRIVMLSL